MVGPGAVALDRVRLLRDLPLELHLGLRGGPRQDHLDALARGLRVAEVHQAGLCRHPRARERAAAGVAGDVGVVALVVDSRRGDPAVLVLPIALLRLRQGHLVPWMALVDRVPQRVLRDERLLVRPVVEIRAAQEDPDHQVDLDQVGRDQLALQHDAGGDVALPPPLGHVPVVVVDIVGIVEVAPTDDVRVAVAPSFPPSLFSPPPLPHYPPLLPSPSLPSFRQLTFSWIPYTTTSSSPSLTLSSAYL